MLAQFGIHLPPDAREGAGQKAARVEYWPRRAARSRAGYGTAKLKDLLPKLKGGGGSQPSTLDVATMAQLRKALLLPSLPT